MARYTKADLKSMTTTEVRNHADRKLPRIPKERHYVETYTKSLDGNPLPANAFIAVLRNKVDDLQQRGVTHVAMRKLLYIQGYRKENDVEFRTRVVEVERARAWILLCRKEIKRRDAAAAHELYKSPADKVVDAMNKLSAKDRAKVLKTVLNDTKNR